MGSEKKAALTLKEAAEELTIGLSMAYKLVKNKKLRVVRIGDRIVVPRSSIREILAPPACSAK